MNKEQLKQNIERMEAELAEMKAKLENSEKFKLEKGKYFLNGNGTISTPAGIINEHNNGATRTTKELAEIASKNMVARNKLEAYVMQLEPEWRADWNNYSQHKYYIYVFKGVFHYASMILNNLIGTVFMSKQTAETLCQWLNEGRITLEKE